MSFDFDDFEVRGRFYDIEEKTEVLREAMQKLYKEEMDELQEAWSIAYIHHDCALDGTVLNHEELRPVCSQKVAQTPRAMNGVQLVRNHHEFLNQLLAQKRVGQKEKTLTLDVETLVALNDGLMYNLPRKKSAQWRQEMPLHRTYFHTFMEPEGIQEGLEAVCRMTEEEEFQNQHPINQASLYHHAFMQVFPFAEGTGTIGRHLMNCFLVRGGYDPCVIHASDRQAYYESLLEGPESLRTLILDSLEAQVEAQIKYVKGLMRDREKQNQRPLSRRGMAV